MSVPTGHDTDGRNRLDQAARALHAEAVARVSPRTLAQLRPHRRSEAAPRHGWRAPPLGWSLATACAAVFVVAIGMRTFAPPAALDAAPAPAVAQATAVPPVIDLYDDPLMAFEEDPDLFLWLASAEARPLAME